MFNCAQRMHLNYLEAVAFVTVVSLVAGIGYPHEAFKFLVIYMVGRFLYFFGYYNLGPIFRVPGVALMWAGQFTNLYYAVKTCLTLDFS